MKIIVFALAIILSSHAFAEETKIVPKSDPKSIQKDYALLCELSKLQSNLAKSDAFKDELPDLIYKTHSMFERVIETDLMRKVASAISTADHKDKEKMWHQSAKDAGLKNWRCRGVGKW